VLLRLCSLAAEEKNDILPSMSVKSSIVRDKQATHTTHRLFWRATILDKPGFIVWFLTRPTALLIYNVLIPFQVAYGLQAIITGQFNQVHNYAVHILLMGLAYCVLWAVGGLAICRNGRIGTEYVQREVFTNYLQKDYEFFNNTFVGSLGSQAVRLREAYNEYCNLFCNSFIKQIVVVVSSVAIIAYQSVTLATVTLLSMLLILSFTILSGKWRFKYRRLLSDANSRVAGDIGDALGQGITIKSFAAEDYEKSRLDRSLRQYVQTLYRSWATSIPVDVGRMLLAIITTAILLLLTARMYEQHTISIAIVVLVQLYVIKLVYATGEIADLVKAYDATMGNAHQALKTMLITPIVQDARKPRRLSPNARLDVELRDITYRYGDAPSQKAALEAVSLHIAQGEKVGIVGYSGSGKTTLTKLLLRFMDTTEGSITVGGIDIRELPQKQLRAKIAYVSQEPLLFHRSIADNIQYGKPTASRQQLLAASHTAYVDEFVAGMPHGYDTLVGEKGVKLSGGQRQRIAIARALLRDAPILVLDEATSALDSQSEQYIQKALWKLMKGRTALVIAHRLSTIQRMDRIVVMDKGRIIEVGTHAQLLQSKGIYAQLWEHQSGGYLIAPDDQDKL
jgi:ATP-binding cassette subfamily B protein